jgi:hypothetical protein
VLQALLQQTPPAQNVELHSPVRSHVVPFDSLGWHVLVGLALVLLQKSPLTQTVSLLQELGHDVEAPLQRYAPHVLVGVLPMGSGKHEPGEDDPVPPQNPQAPQLAEPQQTPLTQLPEAHCRVSVHAAPPVCGATH